MISTSWRPNTRRVLIAALVLSVLIHVFGGALYDYGRRVLLAAHLVRAPMPKPRRNDPVAMSDVIRIERRTVPHQTVVRRPQPQPHPQSRPQPKLDPSVPDVAVPALDPEKPVARAQTPAPVETQKPELSHEVKKPAPRVIAKSGGAPDVTPEPMPVTFEHPAPKPVARPEPKTAKNQLSPQQIAALESRFEKTIQATRENMSTIVDPAKDPAGGPKHYQMNFQGIQDQMRRGQGIFHPVQRQVVGAVVIYHLSYEYTYPDGRVEDDVVPWTFSFYLSDDPWNGRNQQIREVMWQLPPRGFRPSRPLTPQEQPVYDYAQTYYAQNPGKG